MQFVEVSMKSILLVVAAVFSINCLSVQSIAVKDGDELVKALCNMNRPMNFTLNSSVSYEITSQNISCFVRGKYSLVIESKVGIANVTCINQNISSPATNIGIAFVGMESVSVSHIAFTGCGAQLSKDFSNLTASTQLFPWSNYSALFVFVNSSVTFNEVKISNYYGFAVIGINLVSANFTKLHVSNSLSASISSYTKRSTGSGVLIVYTNSSKKTSLIVHNSIFFANDFYDDGECIRPYRRRSSKARVPAAAALTILAYDVSDKIDISISKSVFQYNFGTIAGALLIVLRNADATTVTISQNCHFESNYGLLKCPGGAIGFYLVTQSQRGKKDYSNHTLFPLKVIGTTFLKNRGITGDDPNEYLFRVGAVYIGIKASSSVNISIQFKQVEFHSNNGIRFPSCVCVNVYGYVHSYVHVTLDALTVTENSQTIGRYMLFDTGLFAFVDVYKVEFIGSNKFVSNSGTVLKSYRSLIYLNGENTFNNNTAKSGAAIRIKDSSLHINCSYTLKLERNHVENIGGAIHVESTKFDGLYTCAVQFSSDPCNIQSVNNTADNGGNVMYAYPIYNCYQMYWNRYIDSTENYTNQFEMPTQSTNDNLEVSSKAVNITLESGDVQHFPGEDFSVKASSIDEAGNNVYSLVRLNIVKDKKREPEFVKTGSKISQMATIQAINEKKSNLWFSDLKVKVLFHDDQINETHELYLAVSLLDDIESIERITPIRFMPCPPGFSVGNQGSCGCSPTVKKVFIANGNCDINGRVIQKPTLLVNPWLGVVNGNFAISKICPVEFCNLGELYFGFKSPPPMSNLPFEFVYENASWPMCKKHRMGVLCGECEKGYSVVFGSGECMKCSNWWLWTIALYVVSGPILLYLLFSLRLTLTAGTLNGIIFYAQTANVGLLQIFVLYRDYHPQFFSFFIIFLSLLNLDLGFPLCFFDGMDEFWKAGLTLVFPVYLLLIAVLLIIVSNYSSRLSNRIVNSLIQVLVTVIHLSLSKLLITTIDVFTPVYLYSDQQDRIVWYRNGSIKFFFQRQLIGLMAMTVVITFIFLAPYLMLLVGGKCLIRSSLGDKYFRSAYESIHGPYRENRKYWFVARFFLLITLYLIFAVFRGYNLFLMNIISLPLLIIFLLLQLHLRPFKSKFINILDSFILVDLIIFYFLSWYINFNPQFVHTERYITSFVVLVLIIFLTFVSVIVYHLLLTTGASHRIKAVWNIRKSKTIRPNKSSSRSSFLHSNEVNSSFYSSCDAFREPVSVYK